MFYLFMKIRKSFSFTNLLSSFFKTNIWKVRWVGTILQGYGKQLSCTDPDPRISAFIWIDALFTVVLRIHDIFVWIRIRPDPRIYASDQWIRIRMRIRILLFSSLTFKMPAKNLFKKKISAYYFLKVRYGTFTSFFKGKKSKRSLKTVEIKVFLTIFA